MYVVLRRFKAQILSCLRLFSLSFMQFYTQCFLRRKINWIKDIIVFQPLTRLENCSLFRKTWLFQVTFLSITRKLNTELFLNSVQWKKNLGNENTANLKFLCKVQKLHVRWFPAHVIRAHSQVGCIPRSQSLIFINLTESREFMDVLFISSTTQRNSELIQFNHR